jgi:hypothetical protein
VTKAVATCTGVNFVNQSINHAVPSITTVKSLQKSFPSLRKTKRKEKKSFRVLTLFHGEKILVKKFSDQRQQYVCDKPLKYAKSFHRGSRRNEKILLDSSFNFLFTLTHLKSEKTSRKVFSSLRAAFLSSPSSKICSIIGDFFVRRKKFWVNQMREKIVE